MDKYEEQIARLLAAPDFRAAVRSAWVRATGLFEFVGPTGQNCGCLTMVKNHDAEAYSPELTEQIRNDARVPGDVEDITRESLPVFREYQLRVDQEVGEERQWPQRADAVSK